MGKKNGFRILRCSNCYTVFTHCLPEKSLAQDYDSYYTEANLKVPSFIEKRLAEVLSKLAEYKKAGRILDVGFGAGTINCQRDELGNFRR